MLANHLINCLVCESDQLQPILEVPRVPVQCNVLWPDEASARRAPTGDIALTFCKFCGHSFNAAFRPELVEYSEGYENSLYCSATFREYADQLARKLVSSFQLYRKDVIEIGSGSGEFLKTLCVFGENRGTGFDPSSQPESDLDQTTFIRELYTDKYSHLEADFMVCRHVLEHLVAPRGLLRLMRSALRNSGSGLYVEVPNADFLFAGGSIWDLIYAHISYFSASSLRMLFEQSGFEPIELNKNFNAQFLGIEAVPGTYHDSSPSGDLQVLTALISAFAETYAATVSFWQSEIRRELVAGQRVVLWGAGAKSVSFLNALLDAAPIPYAVDLNPKKQGMFLPGSGAEIVAPARLLELDPDLVVILNPIYENEIRRDLNAMGLSQTRVKTVHACQALAA